jgi:hypothetical protein
MWLNGDSKNCMGLSDQEALKHMPTHALTGRVEPLVFGPAKLPNCAIREAAGLFFEDNYPNFFQSFIFPFLK